MFAKLIALAIFPQTVKLSSDPPLPPPSLFQLHLAAANKIERLPPGLFEIGKYANGLLSFGYGPPLGPILMATESGGKCVLIACPLVPQASPHSALRRWRQPSPANSNRAVRRAIGLASHRRCAHESIFSRRSKLPQRHCPALQDRAVFSQIRRTCNCSGRGQSQQIPKPRGKNMPSHKNMATIAWRNHHAGPRATNPSSSATKNRGPHAKENLPDFRARAVAAEGLRGSE